MPKRWLILLIALLFLPLLASAQHRDIYHLKLLAVEETVNETYQGSDADLYLELKEGSGRVFLETQPLTKLDTQISTRFAKEIACTHFKLNCDQYDFIYTIKAKSNIIGGPSAGAALAALTTLAVLDLDYDETIAITGTINSGGVIGTVGGVKEKIEAASKAGLRKVLIPKGTKKARSLNANTEDNSTVDLITYGQKNLSIEVMEAINLDMAIVELAGIDLNGKDVEIPENEEYSRIMNGLQSLLCSRTSTLLAEIEAERIALPEKALAEIKQKQGQSINASKLGDAYSAASFCFTANIQLREEYYTHQKLTLEQVTSVMELLSKKVLTLQQKVAEQKIETISDLQSLMIVKERVNDVKERIEKFSLEKENITPEESYVLLAYAEERFFSAISWMQFFSMDGKKLVIDTAVLQNACQQKISESEERQQYVGLFLGGSGGRSISEQLEAARKALEAEDFELCLITASQAKANANAILGTLGLAEQDLPDYVASKRKAVERVIAENSREGKFPILGYSYYVYANSLESREPISSLLYLEYALEMSDLGIYFPEEKQLLRTITPFRVRKEWTAFGVGVGAGVALSLLVWWMRKDLVRKKKKR